MDASVLVILWYRGFDHFNELRRGNDVLVAARLDDRRSDPRRHMFFAVFAKHLNDLVLGPRVNDLGGGRVAGFGAVAHVQGFVALEAEAAAAILKLRRGKAEVGKDAGDRSKTFAFNRGGEFGVARINRDEPLA